jgi:hypothetical protein
MSTSLRQSIGHEVPRLASAVVPATLDQPENAGQEALPPAAVDKPGSIGQEVLPLAFDIVPATADSVATIVQPLASANLEILSPLSAAAGLTSVLSPGEVVSQFSADGLLDFFSNGFSTNFILHFLPYRTQCVLKVQCPFMLQSEEKLFP